MPEVVRWTKLSSDREDLYSLLLRILTAVGTAAPAEVKECLPEMMELMMSSNKAWEVYGDFFSFYFVVSNALHIIYLIYVIVSVASLLQPIDNSLH